jgi:hypothetical protein
MEQLVERQCKLCGRPFLLCRRCDGRYRYCSPRCSAAGRRATQREASRTHQQTEEGRQDHRDRQQDYRERQRERVTELCFPAVQPALPLHAVIHADAAGVHRQPEKWARWLGDPPEAHVRIEWIAVPQTRKHDRFLETMGDFASGRRLLSYTSTGRPVVSGASRPRVRRWYRERAALRRQDPPAAQS